MNSTAMDTIKALIEHKKYSAITEYANILHKKDNLIVTEYGGTDVRLYKDNKNNVRLLCPKKMDTVMEGHVAAAIENGTVFDDADTIDTNATCIERLSIPYDAMVNSGRNTPSNLKPMIAIVIGKMNNDGTFDVSDDARNTGTNFVHDLSDAKKNGEKINGVVNNYIEREPDGFYTPEMGKNITGLNREMDEINDTDPGDVVSDEDTVDSYDGIEVDDVESEDEEPEDEEIADVELGNEEEPETDEDDGEGDELPIDNGEEADNDVPSEEQENEEEDAASEDDELDEVEECGENCDSSNKPVVQEEADDAVDSTEDAGATEQMGEDTGDAEAVEEEASNIPAKAPTETGTKPADQAPLTAATKNFIADKVHQEGFFTKKPKKLKPINRDVVAYITVEMNAIHSANDQAMLAGYTCSKIELVDWYITVIDTQDPKYLVPHTRQYLVTMKAQLESLLAQILKIRPINRSEQIWRVNYPQAT